MTGAGLFLAGYMPGLYIVAIAMATNVCYTISAAWLLVIGVFGQEA